MCHYWKGRLRMKGFPCEFWPYFSLKWISCGRYVWNLVNQKIEGHKRNTQRAQSPTVICSNKVKQSYWAWSSSTYGSFCLVGHIMSDISWKFNKIPFLCFSSVLPTTRDLDDEEKIPVSKWLNATSSNVPNCSFCNIQPILILACNKNACIHFSVVLLTDMPPCLVWRVWNSQVRHETV